jgi:mannose-1-phosphate guanylyltransferase/mannose-1-phosphate guanylyltransferase/phosphomannomutase
MKAMILAAGFGTRLLPATKFYPKTCFPVLNRPIIIHIMDNLKRAGVKETVINLHHLSDKIKSVVESFKPKDMKVHFSYEEEILGTAGGIKKVENILCDDTFILYNGDIFSRVDLKAAVKFHKKNKSKATMIVKEGGHPSFIGLDNKFAIKRFPYGELKESKDYTLKTFFTGIHILEPGVFDYIPPDIPCGINSLAYPDMLKNGHNIYGYVTDAYWQDIGTPQDYIVTNFCQLDDKKVKEMKFKSSFSYGNDSSIIEPSLVGKGVVIERGCTIGPYAVIGNGCVIGKDCNISGSIIFDDVVIKRSSSVKNSIILEGCVIPAYNMIKRSVVTNYGRHVY